MYSKYACLNILCLSYKLKKYALSVSYCEMYYSYRWALLMQWFVYFFAVYAVVNRSILQVPHYLTNGPKFCLWFELNRYIEQQIRLCTGWPLSIFLISFHTVKFRFCRIFWYLIREYLLKSIFSRRYYSQTIHITPCSSRNVTSFIGEQFTFYSDNTLCLEVKLSQRYVFSRNYN